MCICTPWPHHWAKVLEKKRRKLPELFGHLQYLLFQALRTLKLAKLTLKNFPPMVTTPHME